MERNLLIRWGHWPSSHSDTESSRHLHERRSWRTLLEMGSEENGEEDELRGNKERESQSFDRRKGDVDSWTFEDERRERVLNERRWRGRTAGFYGQTIILLVSTSESNIDKEPIWKHEKFSPERESEVRVDCDLPRRATRVNPLLCSLHVRRTSNDAFTVSLKFTLHFDASGVSFRRLQVKWVHSLFPKMWNFVQTIIAQTAGKYRDERPIPLRTRVIQWTQGFPCFLRALSLLNCSRKCDKPYSCVQSHCGMAFCCVAESEFLIDLSPDRWMSVTCSKTERMESCGRSSERDWRGLGRG